MSRPPSSLPSPPPPLGLPPRVSGPVQYLLSLTVLQLAWTRKSNELHLAGNGNGPSVVRVHWWGEDGPGALLYPPNLDRERTPLPSIAATTSSPSSIPILPVRATGSPSIPSTKRNCVQYPVRCSKRQLRAYFRDMGHLNVRVLVKGRVVGTAVIRGLDELTADIPQVITGVFPVFPSSNERGGFEVPPEQKDVAVAEMSIVITLDGLQGESAPTEADTNVQEQQAADDGVLKEADLALQDREIPQSEMDSPYGDMLPQTRRDGSPESISHEPVVHEVSVSESSAPSPAEFPGSDGDRHTATHSPSGQADILLELDAEAYDYSRRVAAVLRELDVGEESLLDDYSDSGQHSASDFLDDELLIEALNTGEGNALLEDRVLGGPRVQRADPSHNNSESDYDSDDGDRLSDDERVRRAVLQRKRRENASRDIRTNLKTSNPFVSEVLASISHIVTTVTSIELLSQYMHGNAMKLRVDVRYPGVPAPVITVDTEANAKLSRASAIGKRSLDPYKSRPRYIIHIGKTSSNTIQFDQSLQEAWTHGAIGVKVTLEPRTHEESKQGMTRNSLISNMELIANGKSASSDLLRDENLQMNAKVPLFVSQDQMPAFNMMNTRSRPRRGPLRLLNSTGADQVYVGDLYLKVHLEQPQTVLHGSQCSGTLAASDKRQSPMPIENIPKSPRTSGSSPILSYFQLQITTARSLSVMPAFDGGSVPIYLIVKMFSSANPPIETPPISYSQPFDAATGKLTDPPNFNFVYTLPVTLDDKFLLENQERPLIVEVWVANETLARRGTYLESPPSDGHHTDHGAKLLGLLRLPVHQVLNAAAVASKSGNDFVADKHPIMLPEAEHQIVDPFTGLTKGWLTTSISIGTWRQVRGSHRLSKGHRNEGNPSVKDHIPLKHQHSHALAENERSHRKTRAGVDQGRSLNEAIAHPHGSYGAINAMGQDLESARGDLDLDDDYVPVQGPTRTFNRKSGPLKDTDLFGDQLSAVSGSKYTLEVQQTTLPAIPIEICIEKALHLPLMGDPFASYLASPFVTADEKQMVPPNTFVTFEWDEGRQHFAEHQTLRTHIAPAQRCPSWNAKFMIHQPQNERELKLLKNEKTLLFHIWHAPDINVGRTPVPTVDIADVADEKKSELIGSARVDLGSLFSGFKELHGWYHIMDGRGNLQGQLLVKVRPQEELAAVLRRLSGLKDELHSSGRTSKGSGRRPLEAACSRAASIGTRGKPERGNTFRPSTIRTLSSPSRLLNNPLLQSVDTWVWNGGEWEHRQVDVKIVDSSEKSDPNLCQEQKPSIKQTSSPSKMAQNLADLDDLNARLKRRTQSLSEKREYFKGEELSASQEAYQRIYHGGRQNHSSARVMSTQFSEKCDPRIDEFPVVKAHGKAFLPSPEPPFEKELRLSQLDAPSLLRSQEPENIPEHSQSDVLSGDRRDSLHSCSPNLKPISPTAQIEKSHSQNDQDIVTSIAPPTPIYSQPSYGSGDQHLKNLPRPYTPHSENELAAPEYCPPGTDDVPSSETNIHSAIMADGDRPSSSPIVDHEPLGTPNHIALTPDDDSPPDDDPLPSLTLIDHGPHDTVNRTDMVQDSYSSASSPSSPSSAHSTLPDHRINDNPDISFKSPCLQNENYRKEVKYDFSSGRRASANISFRNNGNGWSADEGQATDDDEIYSLLTHRRIAAAAAAIGATRSTVNHARPTKALPIRDSTDATGSRSPQLSSFRPPSTRPRGFFGATKAASTVTWKSPQDSDLSLDEALESISSRFSRRHDGMRGTLTATTTDEEQGKVFWSDDTF